MAWPRERSGRWLIPAGQGVWWPGGGGCRQGGRGRGQALPSAAHLQVSGGRPGLTPRAQALPRLLQPSPGGHCPPRPSREQRWCWGEHPAALQRQHCPTPPGAQGPGWAAGGPWSHCGTDQGEGACEAAALLVPTPSHEVLAEDTATSELKPPDCPPRERRDHRGAEAHGNTPEQPAAPAARSPGHRPQGSPRLHVLVAPGRCSRGSALPLLLPRSPWGGSIAPAPLVSWGR